MDDNPHDVFNLPGNMYKYYKFDSALNESRLTGDVYLASPLDFNDPCDCRLEVRNNVNEIGKGEQWVAQKMEELGYGKSESVKVARSLMAGDDRLDEVYHRQLQKLGILCTTGNFNSLLMWGYYTNNDGFCIEYDGEKLLVALIVGFVNALDFDMTRMLYVNKAYWNEPSIRCNDLPAEILEKAASLRLANYVGGIDNAYLSEKSDTVKANFLTNILLKRFAGEMITYSGGDEILCYRPTLFFDKSNEESKKKYFVKTEAWKHEREFRIIVSLGGNKVIKLGREVVKNVYLGCNTPEKKIMEIASSLAKNGMECGLFLMRRRPDCSLENYKLNYRAMLNGYKCLEQSIESIKKETGKESAEA